MEEEEELLLNAISAITNLSFHSNHPRATLWQHRFALAEGTSARRRCMPIGMLSSCSTLCCAPSRVRQGLEGCGLPLSAAQAPRTDTACGVLARGRVAVARASRSEGCFRLRLEGGVVC
eukprot:3406697-Rhodomonas_salina.2